MATTYTHAKVEDIYEIYRDGEHIASYNPVTKDTTYTNKEQKYVSAVTRQVNKVKAEQEESKQEESKQDDSEQIQLKLNKLTAENSQLKQSNAELKQSNAELKQKVNHTCTGKCGNKNNNNNINSNNTLERFQDEVDESDAPVKNPMLGDLTPEYIELARKGGMSEEVFNRRYKGHI